MTGSGDFSIGSKVWPGTSKLLEEMGELQQVLGKLQQTLGKLIAVAGSTTHWSGDLREMMIEECADVAAALQFFTVENFTREDLLQMLNRSEEKKALFRKWHFEQIPRRCFECSPMGNRCEKPEGHSGTCHANDGKHVEDWKNV